MKQVTIPTDFDERLWLDAEALQRKHFFLKCQIHVPFMNTDKTSLLPLF